MTSTRTLGGMAVLVFVFVAATDALGGGDSAKQPSNLDALIRRLGDDDFHVREKATRELLRIGSPARAALQRAFDHPDLEIRQRCRRLLPAIVEADRQAKIAAFLADKDGKLKVDLPGWSRYRKIVGDDEAARRFFADLHKANGEFLAEAEGKRDKAGLLCARYCRHLLQQQQRLLQGGIGFRPIAIEEIAPLLLIAADAKVKIPIENRWQFASLLQQQNLRSELKARRVTPSKKIALAWMERQAEDEFTAQLVYGAINDLKLKEGLDIALKAVRGQKLKGSALGHALVTIGLLGDRKHLPLIEPHLDDAAQICGFAIGGAGGNVNGQTQVRDVALAMLVRLTKQSEKDYGFAVAKINQPFLMNQANYLGFSTEKERDAALAKWKAWKAARKK
jgi:hypothetical protein